MGLDIGLPENLQLKLKSFEKRLKLYETLFVILGALSGAAFSWLILYVSDRFWDTAIIFRILISVSAILCAAAFSYFWLFHWIFHKRNLRQLASIIQSEHQILGDRLQGIVELVEQSDIHDISPALIRAAIRKVASEADDLEFTDAVDKRGSRKAFTICTVLAVFVVSLMVFNVHAGVNAFQRWAMPTADIPRYTFVSVEALPDTLYVPHGEAFTIEIFDIKYDDASFFKPTEAEANCSNQAILEVSIHKNRARFEIPGQTEQISLFLSVGDYDKTIKVEPLYRPVLKDLTAYIVYPEYLERGQNLQKVSAGYFSVLEKSTVSFKASFSRAIKAASFSNKVKTKIDNDHFLSDKYEIAKAEKIEIGFTDIHGLKPQKNYVLNLQVRKDKMPIVEFPDQAASVAILINESVEMSIEASDDFGLKYLTLEWDIYDLQERKRHHETYKQILLKGGPYKDKLKRTFIFSPEQMKIPDQTMVILKAKAKDYNPNSKAAYSMERKIYILSYEEHEKLIRKRFEELQTQLEEQIRQEENQKHDTEDMAKKKDLKDSKHNDKIAELSKNESANRREIERIVQKGMKLLKEALRNKNISESMIREWAKMLNGLKNIKSSEMKSAQGKLNKALKNPPSRNEDMKKAAENMAEAIKKMQKLLKNLDKSLEQMTAMNFVNRLKAMARKEGEIKRDLKAIFADTIGANKDDLDAKYKKVLSKQAVSLTEIRRESEYLMEDIGQFFNRTRLVKYEKIFKDMEKLKLLDKIDEHKAFVLNNRTIKSMELAVYWEAQFKKWAKMLKKDNMKKKPPGPPQEGKPLTPEQMELLIKLMRIIQGEQELRKQTRKLDNNKDLNPTYNKDAEKLVTKQKDLKKILEEVIKKVPPKAKPTLKKAGKAMDDAVQLLAAPRTDGVTIAAINEVIELLTQGSDQTSKSMGGGAPGMGMMSMLQQMMKKLGKGEGNQPGEGSTAGGGIGDSNFNSKTDASEDKRDAETSEKITGKDIEKLPEEFKDLMKSYYGELEKIEK